MRSSQTNIKSGSESISALVKTMSSQFDIIAPTRQSPTVTLLLPFDLIYFYLGMSDGIIKLLDAKTGKIRSSLSTVSGEAFQVHQENAISSISCLRYQH